MSTRESVSAECQQLFPNNSRPRIQAQGVSSLGSPRRTKIKIPGRLLPGLSRELSISSLPVASTVACRRPLPFFDRRGIASSLRSATFRFPTTDLFLGRHGGRISLFAALDLVGAFTRIGSRGHGLAPFASNCTSPQCNKKGLRPGFLRMQMRCQPNLGKTQIASYSRLDLISRRLLRCFERIFEIVLRIRVLGIDAQRCPEFGNGPGDVIAAAVDRA